MTRPADKQSQILSLDNHEIEDHTRSMTRTMSHPKDRQPITLSLHNSGTTKFPRYMISDQYLRYWTGDEWTEQQDETHAYIYADYNTAMEDMHKLMLKPHEQLPVHRFAAPLYIELHTDQKFTEDQLQDWLIKVTKLLMDTPNHGNGPFAGSYVACRIEYNELGTL